MASDTPRPAARRRLLLAAGGVLIAAGVGVLIWIAIAPGGAENTPASNATGASVTSLAPSGSSATSTLAAPSPTAAPSEEPPATPTAAPPPPSGAGPVIGAFSVSPSTVTCRDERSAAVPLSFSWAAEGADMAWIGVGTTDAAAQPFAEVAPTVTGYSGLQFTCDTERKLFTLTVEGEGVRTSRTIAVVRQLE